MAFTKDSLVRINGQAQAQAMFTYYTTDAAATVTAAGYFNSALGTLRESDYIFVRNSSEDYILRVSSAVKDNVSAELLTYLTNSAQASGWFQASDNTYTSSSPFSITANVRTKLDFNADSIIDTYVPSGTTASTFYDTVNNKIYGENDGDAFIIRVNATVKPAATNSYITFDLDIGGSQGIILENTRSLIKGTAAQPVSKSDLIYTLNTFNTNGGEIYVTCNNNCDFYDMSFVMTRVHKGPS